MDQQKDIISFDEFAKSDIRAGTIISCVAVEKSDRLYKLDIDFGPLGIRTILTGMQKFYTPETFVGLQTLFIINLEPRKMMGLESQGMLLSVGLDHNDRPTLIKLSDTAKNGDGVC